MNCRSILNFNLAIIIQYPSKSLRCRKSLLNYSVKSIKPKLYISFYLVDSSGPAVDGRITYIKE